MLEYEYQMLQKEAEAKREDFETGQKVLREEQNDYSCS